MKTWPRIVVERKPAGATPERILWQHEGREVDLSALFVTSVERKIGMGSVVPQVELRLFAMLVEFEVTETEPIG